MPRISDFISLRWGPKIYIPSKFPGDADAALRESLQKEDEVSNTINIYKISKVYFIIFIFILGQKVEKGSIFYSLNQLLSLFVFYGDRLCLR